MDTLVKLYQQLKRQLRILQVLAVLLMSTVFTYSLGIAALILTALIAAGTIIFLVLKISLSWLIHKKLLMLFAYKLLLTM